MTNEERLVWIEKLRAHTKRVEEERPKLLEALRREAPGITAAASLASFRGVLKERGLL
jgi:hypothetical protein